MAVKKYLLSFACISCFTAQAQLPDNFGVVTPSEENMSVYEKDTTANAVVLYERGDNYFQVINNGVYLIKKHHVKIKIFNEKAYDLGTIEIPLYHSGSSTEKLTEIKAVTHNDGRKHSVSPSEIFTNDLSEHWREKKFTFPDLRPGSILEYSYTIETPYYYNFTGWDFQTTIPVLHSEFNAKIPGNWLYNRSLSGSLKLTTDTASLKRDCFRFVGSSKTADCEVLQYIMKDVPAFHMEEDYMLGASNYISRIDFELAEYTSWNGQKKKFTKSWKNVDHEFRTDKDIGRQLTKTGFFEKNVPEKLVTEGDEITRAKAIFDFVQQHYTWNEKFGIYGKARVKEAFDAKSGTVSEINMSLINLLHAAGIKTNLMLLSTRKRGLPKVVHPVMSDFNYCIAKVEIDGRTYLLDATDKHMAFGMLPFRALNHYGRVMDFKNESYWYDIKPNNQNLYQVRAQLKFDLDEKKAFGIFDVVNRGYNAINTKKELARSSEEAYLDSFEEQADTDFSITSYELREAYCTDTQVSERFEFEMESVLNADMVYLNPFLLRFFSKNPFLLEERQYPVDFGYQRAYKYTINITIPEGYVVQEIPKPQAVRLGNQLVTFNFMTNESQNQIAIAFDLDLKSSHIKPDNYQGLKSLFKHVTDIQNNSLVVLKKI